tara:strand:- start:2650 stop:3417 length:768 start_codon:yes stop_codon:yes gene_type:complete
MTNENQIELFPSEGDSANTVSNEEVVINEKTNPETTSETPVETTTETQETTNPVSENNTAVTEESSPSVAEKPDSNWTGLNAEQERQAKETQERLAYYEEQQRQNAIVTQAEQYKKQLEDQGYMPEQAQQIADMQVQQANRDYEMQKTYNNQLQHMRGKFAAVSQFAKDYGVAPDQLMQFEDPKSMEAFAKKEKKIKDLENELAKYKDKQVPPQSFDNSQAEPSASTSEDRLLDLYNQGVRNADTEAAARRATGL